MQCTPLTAPSRCFFSRITHEIGIVLTLLGIENLTQPVNYLISDILNHYSTVQEYMYHLSCTRVWQLTAW